MPIRDTLAATFCPRCRKAGEAGAALCQECGESLADQAYCHVCGTRWRLRAGEPCPKHDVPLEDPPPAESSEAAGRTFTDWVSVAGYPHTLAAEAPRIRLEAEGIPTFLEGSRMAEHGMYQIATGGVRLQVPRDLAGEARILLSQTWSPPPEPDDDLEDAWDDLAPESGSTRRALMRLAIILVLAFPAFRLILLILGGR